MDSNKLNILILPKWYPHDADPFDGNFVENHAHAIKQISKLSVIFVHSEERKDGPLFRFEEKDNLGINEMRVYFKKANSPFSILNGIINLKRYAKAQELAYERMFNTHSPDLVHVHVLARSALLALKLLKKGIPYVITEHWSGYLPESSALKKSGKTWYYRSIANKAKAIHTVTQHLANAMQAHGVKNEFKVIPNVVKEDLFLPKKKSSNKMNILFVGNILQHPKRILDIIEVFAQIAQDRRDFTLNIYGEGKDLDRMMKKIHQLGLKDLLHYHGTKDRSGIAQVMGEADFLLLFSEFENQPCVINEALCCGIPVVVPDIEGIKEFMQDDFGLIFNRLDKEDFQAKITEMMDTYDDYESDLIRKKAVAQFGEEAIAKEFLAFYQKALKS